MLVKVSELTDIALNWAVATCEGHEIESLLGGAVWYWLKCSLTGKAEVVEVFNPTRDWSQGGPIIDKEKIYLEYWDEVEEWIAGTVDGNTEYFSTNPLVAAMRCYVASKLGDTIDVPEELLK